jgi:hypothetical protein
MFFAKLNNEREDDTEASVVALKIEHELFTG